MAPELRNGRYCSDATPVALLLGPASRLDRGPDFGIRGAVEAGLRYVALGSGRSNIECDGRQRSEEQNSGQPDADRSRLYDMKEELSSPLQSPCGSGSTTLSP